MAKITATRLILLINGKNERRESMENPFAELYYTVAAVVLNLASQVIRMEVYILGKLCVTLDKQIPVFTATMRFVSHLIFGDMDDE